MKRIPKIMLIFISATIVGLIGLAMLFREINIFQRPDLIPEDLQVVTVNASSVTIFWKLKNIGDEIIPLAQSEKQHGSSADINLYVYVSKDTIIRKPEDSLSMMIRANDNHQIALTPQQSLAGSHRMSIPNVRYPWKCLMMHIDPNNEIKESNEANNIAYVISGK